MSSDTRLWLASRSPRRRELLHQIGVEFSQVDVAVDESVNDAEAPDAYVCRLAVAKAEAGYRRVGGGSVLGADTAVVLGDEVLGKPRDRDHALAMLASLAGREHRVLSAVALASAAGTTLRLSATKVRFRALGPGEAARYWVTGEAADKAGGYAIQGRAAVFVEAIEGSYSGVVGLPLKETWELLCGAGIHVL